MAIGYLNGKIINSDDPVLPIDERGHQFGDGVYEYIRVYGGRPFMMKEHLDRFFKSAEAIKLNLDHSREDIEEITADLIKRSGLSDCDIYMQATRGIAPRNHLFPNVPASISMTVKPFRAMDETLRENGASIKLLPDERWQNCWIKTLNLLPNLLAKQEAFEAGAFEAVLVRDGVVTEGSSSNLFLVKEGELITPPATKHILHGITRMAVIDIAAELGIPVKEETFAPEAVLKADEVFLTSTGIEIVPVTTADDQKIGSGKPGDITKKIYEAFMKRV
ncbi:D-amino-acid transaminase [Domibacillus sp. DTU_2020_1001157_1_SI_ALB_TIR_016]|uniref:D-amino-acid transaminase n=1 Tax=Domibacillus sp. DTU_2020_1001157_1_SI_ALB_TIR_016 TaxID=3077789 RepID=UPI0028E617A7|nr:D-amino-acid transaminase [Domibacillus sp. DTU_2020_1001157_1_SI_ALB_TIR_016]WNS81045.1 D-amino-acid transaminase [Domibacillus sp. DTU_2020_1001157_1_SI_ALB_TIR_016]